MKLVLTSGLPSELGPKGATGFRPKNKIKFRSEGATDYNLPCQCGTPCGH